MKRNQWLTWLFLVGFVTFSVVVSNFNAVAKTNCKDAQYQIDYEKDKQAITQHYNIEIKAPNVIEKTGDIRKILYKIPNTTLESFSCSKDNAQIRLYMPLKNEDIVMKLFADDPELSSFSSNTRILTKKYKILLLIFMSLNSINCSSEMVMF